MKRSFLGAVMAAAAGVVLGGFRPRPPVRPKDPMAAEEVLKAIDGRGGRRVAAPVPIESLECCGSSTAEFAGEIEPGTELRLSSGDELKALMCNGVVMVKYDGELISLVEAESRELAMQNRIQERLAKEAAMHAQARAADPLSIEAMAARTLKGRPAEVLGKRAQRRRRHREKVDA